MSNLAVFDHIIEFDTLSLEQRVASITRDASKVEEEIGLIMTEANHVVGLLQSDQEIKDALERIQLLRSELDEDSRTESFKGQKETINRDEAHESSDEGVQPTDFIDQMAKARQGRVATERKKLLKDLYRKLATLTHPDSSKSDKETRKLFPTVEQAYREGNFYMLQQLLQSLEEYLSAKKSNKKRRKILQANLAKALNSLNAARARLQQLKRSDAYHVVDAYRKVGLDAAKAIHLKVLAKEVAALTMTLNHRRRVKNPSVFSFLTSTTTFHF